MSATTGNVRKLKSEPTVEESKPKRFLSAQDIFSADDITTIDVFVPEWDGYVRLRKLSAAVALKMASEDVKLTPGEHDVLLIMQSAINEDGSPLFPNKESFETLKEKSLTAIRRLQRAVLDLNRVSDPGKV